MTDPRPIYDARWFIHLCLTGVMASVAIQLILPTNTYGVLPDGSIHSNWLVIAHYMSEQTCGGLCWMVACVGGLGLWPSHPVPRLVATVVLALAHSIMALTFLWSNPAGIGSILLAWFAAQGYYLVYRRTAEGLR